MFSASTRAADTGKKSMTIVEWITGVHSRSGEWKTSTVWRGLDMMIERLDGWRLERDKQLVEIELSEAITQFFEWARHCHTPRRFLLSSPRQPSLGDASALCSSCWTSLEFTKVFGFMPIFGIRQRCFDGSVLWYENIFFHISINMAA